MESIRRLFRPPDESFFLFGPRGTGKSTLVKGGFPDAIYIDLLDPVTYRTFSARPEHLRELLGGHPSSRTVIVDEIQRAPELLSLIHALMEEDSGRRFVLTGSSARKLKRVGVDLLGGRALWCSMYPFMASELGPRFLLDNALQHGMLPVVLRSEDPGQVLRGYAALYLREEVQMEGLVRNVGAFARFLESVSFSHASLLNVANVARDCQVERKVVEGYVAIMEDLLLGFRVDVFAKRAKRALVAHPKFYVFDAGVYRSLRPKGPLDRPEEIEGHALEGLVAQHLRAWAGYSRTDDAVYYWRTRAGVEVDFVVYGSSGLFAVEVKNAARLQPRDLASLKAFRTDYPDCHACLVYRGRERLMVDGILCMPCTEFLAALRPGVQPIPEP